MKEEITSFSVKIGLFACALGMMLPVEAETIYGGEAPCCVPPAIAGVPGGENAYGFAPCAQGASLTPEEIEVALQSVESPVFSDTEARTARREMASVVCACDCNCSCASCVTSCGACSCECACQCHCWCQCSCESSCGIPSCACACSCCGGTLFRKPLAIPSLLI
ncbi:MAG: hypothetical protein RDV48_27710 [Candidatus Eremiobacteraeota bacterium]|nr:hypothetical protein [Candidatus Eremiobacteraeota bacterium]